VKYNASRGGHAPHHLRDAFVEWLHAEYLNADAGAEGLSDTVKVGGEEKPSRWLLGQLWNCTDTMPGDECSFLDLPQGSTYAQAVRKVVADLDNIPIG
jgi:hypothetical protein